MAFPKLREVDFLADFLNSEIEKQSWFRANANTITSLSVSSQPCLRGWAPNRSLQMNVFSLVS